MSAFSFLLAFGLHAQTFTYNNINYTILTPSTVSISSTQNANVSGAIVVPATVSNRGTTYKVTSISTNAFKGNKNITSFKAGANLFSIQARAFDGCTGLMSIDFGNVLELGANSFAYCSGVSTLSISSSLSMIATDAFYGMTGLNSVTIASKTIEDYFQCNTSLKTVELTNKALIISDKAFMGCSSLQTVSNANNVTTIGRCAFDGCKNLKSIDLTTRFRSLGYKAFAYCESLTSAPNLSFVSEISPLAFAGCKNIKSFTINSITAKIGYNAFDGCSSITSITLPNSITTLGDCMFKGCTSLKSFTFASGTDTIGDNVFGDCKSLTSINVPSTVKSLGVAIFSGCSNLSNVNFASYPMTEIRNSTFFGCQSLTSFAMPKFPKRVNAIGDYAFAYSGIENAEISNIKTVGNGAYEGCSNLKSIALYDYLTVIKPYTFYGCKSLTMFNDPGFLKTIGESAFQNSSVTTVYLSSSVTSVEKNAFRGCEKLKTICCDNGTPPAAPEKVFDDWNYTNTTLACRTASKASYASADEWKYFKIVTPTTSIYDVQVASGEVKEIARFTIGGIRIFAPQKGINIVKMSDGTIHKVMVK